MIREEGGDLDREALSYIKTKSGESYFEDADGLAMALPALCTGFCVLSDGGASGAVLPVSQKLWSLFEAAWGISGRKSV